MELVAGCYEQVLLGFATRPGQSWTVVPDFTHHAHSASLSAVAVNNRYVVTGSRDETIQIYDMKKRIEHGALLQHNGTITCLEFYGTAHLLSGAEDGLICIWNTKRWECLKSIKAHKGHVTSLSIHPSGKLALSVGTDKTLRTWNLVEGRSAFIKNLKQNAHIIKWSPDGEKYVTVITNKVDIYSLDTASITGTITTEKRISSLRFITDSILAIAGDDEMIRFYSCDSQKCLCEFKAHENRIKDIFSFEREGQYVIVTASSDGYIKMWNLDLDKIKDGPSLLCEVNTKARLTCLAVWLDRASEMKENSDKTATSCQETEDEKSSIARIDKDFWTTKRVKIARRKRKIIPGKQKLEAPVQKKKKKQNNSA
ncbi:p21-activated protein kinase-interacting protein 1-like [Lonchura striata]|uniref:P21-activated protein kinase-interacting protein 1-like n=1 Tax=Lonchura striata TaxID=40157 RepID=A0A218UWK8_9PASE|nr:p21-activated protein kinase-interacting protein 1 [Lonchura striata domestica]OWK57722.1 p21-activated protein kinase-interacting protein 1-like [Lonchura striata domestica]